jgi:LysM repeat protein
MKRLLILISLFVFYNCSAQVSIQKSEEKTLIDGREFYLHKVNEGETLFSISKAYEASLEDIYNANPGLEANLFIGEVIRIPVPSEIDKVKYIVHNVESGETLFSLFRKYNVSKEEFYEHNQGMNENSTIRIGQQLLFLRKELPESGKDFIQRDTSRFHYHEIKRGETLFSLSRKYNIDKEKILLANPGIDETNISIGQIVLIPRIDDIPYSERQHIIDSLARINFDPYYRPGSHIGEIIDTNDCDTLLSEIRKPEINIALLLPFEVSKNISNLSSQSRSRTEQRLTNISADMVNFFMGTLLAIDKHKDTDIKINYKIYDIGRTNNVIRELIDNGSLDNMDFIIGPAFRSQAGFLAENYNNNECFIILPFTGDINIAEENPNIIMARTSTLFERLALVDYAKNNPDNNYIVLHDNRDENKELASIYSKNLNYAINNESLVKTLLFDDNKINGLSTAINKEKTNVIIVLFTGEYELFRIFTELFPLKDYHICVIGDKTIIDYETIDPKFYLDNNFTYFSSFNVNYKTQQTIDFISSYRREFLSEPTDLSFLGYDIIDYFIPALAYYGDYFADCINNKKAHKGLSGELLFSKHKDLNQNSMSNSCLYVYQINDSYGFNLIYPRIVDSSIEIVDEDRE